MARIYLETSAIDDLAKSAHCSAVVSRLRAGRHTVFASLDAVLELLHARFSEGGIELVHALLRPLQLLGTDLKGLPEVVELLPQCGHLPDARVPTTFLEATEKIQWLVRSGLDEQTLRQSYRGAVAAKKRHLEVNKQARKALEDILAKSGGQKPSLEDAIHGSVRGRSTIRDIRRAISRMGDARVPASQYRFGRSMLLRVWAMGQITNMYRGTTADSNKELKRLPGPNDLMQFPYMALCDWFVLHDEPMHESMDMARSRLARSEVGRPLRYEEFEGFVMGLDPGAW